MALSKHGEYYPVWEGIQTGRYVLCISNEILSEYHEIISQLLTETIADNVVRLLTECPFVEYVDPHYHLHLIEIDPDDNKFVDCAFASNATYIVSNDHHFDVLKTIDFPKIQVIKLIEFLEIISH
jgi:putative PIN family toxin of toxin-antitoxin system